MSTPEEQTAPPQPNPKHSLRVMQIEIDRLREENNELRNNNLYLSALYNDSQEMIGSLLEQISRETPAPDDENVKTSTES